MKLQAKAAEQSQDSRSQETKRHQNQLDTRYGKIGISAVAAAVSHLREPHTVGEYRIPFDRD